MAKMKTNLGFMISALMVLAILATPALALGKLSVTRTMAEAVAPGETFEVRLSVDVPDTQKPRTYILVENIPKGFTIADTDAKMKSDENGIMKWIVVEGLFGAKVEDTAYVYHLRAPGTTGAYSFNGSSMLEDRTTVATSGAASLNVSESAKSSGKNSQEYIQFGYDALPYILAALLIIVLVSAALRMKSRSTKRTLSSKTAPSSFSSQTPIKTDSSAKQPAKKIPASKSAIASKERPASQPPYSKTASSSDDAKSNKSKTKRRVK